MMTNQKSVKDCLPIFCVRPTSLRCAWFYIQLTMKHDQLVCLVPPTLKLLERKWSGTVSAVPTDKRFWNSMVTDSVQDWSPHHMSFILKGSQISPFQLKGWLKSKTSIQEYRNEIRNSYWTCAWIIWYMFPVQCHERRTNHLTLLLVVTMPYAC